LLLSPGDTLVLHTDGATDMTNPAGENFGHERLWAAIQASAAASVTSAQGMCDLALEALRDYQGAIPQADDVTLVVIRATG
jgi:serine phosphatase RsbU (regulator of sigma subunit)